MLIDLGTAYAASRERLSALVAGLGEAGPSRAAKAVQVECCPGWSVHDVIGHLVAVAEDAVAGRITGPPSDEQASEQVARWAEETTARVLVEWQERAPGLERLLRETPIWPALMDVLSHEHDVRQALGAPGGRNIPEIAVCARQLIKRLDTGVDLQVTMDGEDFRPGRADPDEAGDGEPALRLETTGWEAFRFRLGRRSRSQLAQLHWTGDPSPVLDKLTIFGPSPVDIIE